MVSLEQVEILILENALRSAQEHVARCDRRFIEAATNLTCAKDAVTTLERSIKEKREEWLLRSVI